MAGAGVEIGGILLDVVLVILAAKVAGEVFERFGQSAVLGELLAGLIVGPTVFGLIPNVFDTVVTDVGTEAIFFFLAELGAIILLFEVGIESNLKDLLRVGRAASMVALIGIVASVAVGYGASFVIGDVLGWWPSDPLFHLFVGATFAATSVGITARVLKDMGRLKSPEARIILGAAVLDDVGGLLVLALVAGLVTAHESGQAFSLVTLAKTFGLAIGFLVVALLVGIKLLPPLFDRVAKLRGRGAIMAFAMLFAALLAYVADVVGLATIVGAFAAGLILAQTRQHHQIFDGTRPLGDVFIPFFFVALGAAVNLREVAADEVGRVALLVAALLVAATLAKLACGLGVSAREANRWVVGVGMVPRGEVGLIFIVFGIQHFAIPQWVSVTLILVVMLTTVVTPVWLRALYKGAPPMEPAAAEPAAH